MQEIVATRRDASLSLSLPPPLSDSIITSLARAPFAGAASAAATFTTAACAASLTALHRLGASHCKCLLALPIVRRTPPVLLGKMGLIPDRLACLKNAQY